MIFMRPYCGCLQCVNDPAPLKQSSLVLGFFNGMSFGSKPNGRRPGLIFEDAHRNLFRARRKNIFHSPGTRTILKALGESRVLLVWYDFSSKPNGRRPGLIK